MYNFDSFYKSNSQTFGCSLTSLQLFRCLCVREGLNLHLASQIFVFVKKTLDTHWFCMDYEILTLIYSHCSIAVYECLKFVSDQICTVPMSSSLLLHLNDLNGNRYISILSNCVTKLCSYSVVIVFRVHLFAFIYLWIYLFIMWCIFELCTFSCSSWCLVAFTGFMFWS